MKKKLFLPMVSSIFFVMLMLTSCENLFDDGNVVNYNGKYICISLSHYVDDLYKRISSGETAPSGIDTLFGMSWIDGYIIDSKNKDIILVGEQKKGRPVYHSEDIFVNYQNVFGSAQPPYCSLDPGPENILQLNKYLAMKTNDVGEKIRNCRDAVGGQKVVIGGVPINSRMAKIMIYADYDMKKISQGLMKAPNISSTIDLSIADSTNTSSTNASLSRFWLHIKEDEDNKIYPNYSENEGIVFINECPVVVLTEKQKIDTSGNLTDNDSEKDKIANSFAAEMSTHYSALASKNVLFAELENMFRLQACLKAMKFKGAMESSGINLSKIYGLKLAKGNELPASLPGLINYKLLQKNSHAEIGTMFFIVAGGVSEEMKVTDENLRADDSELLLKSGKIIIDARPNANSNYWYAVIQN